MNILRFDALDSTNATAKGHLPGTAIVAAVQLKGRGRLGRVWDSGRGGLWMSIVIDPEDSPFFHHTLVAAVACQKAVENSCMISAEVKWPNDLILEGKKVCGILTEPVSRGDDHRLIIGIGMNVNNILPRELLSTGLALREVAGKEIDLEQLLLDVVSQFEAYEGIYWSDGIAPILSLWEKHCCHVGRWIIVKTMEKEVNGIYSGISEDGSLLLKHQDGSIGAYSEGDVSMLLDHQKL